MYTHLTRTQAQTKIEQVIEAFHRTAHQETLWHGWPGSRIIAQTILEQLPIAWQPEPVKRGHKVSTGTFQGLVEFVEPDGEHAWVTINKTTQRYLTTDLQLL